MIRAPLMADPYEVSGCIVPTGESAAVAGGRFCFVWRRFFRATHCRPRCCGDGWQNCWRGFHPRPLLKNCGCLLRWKPSIGCGASCSNVRTVCEQDSVVSKSHPAAGAPIRCCKRLNTSGVFFHADCVRRLIFNFIFSVRFWVEQTSGPFFWPKYHRCLFPAASCVRATTQQYHPLS